jgi:hypothetical protein
VLRALRASGVVTILALSIVGPGALVAAGDDGPPRTPPTDRPTRTVLRPTELPDQARPVVAKQSDKIVILLVSTFCVLPALLVVFLGPPLLSLVG